MIVSNGTRPLAHYPVRKRKRKKKKKWAGLSYENEIKVCSLANIIIVDSWEIYPSTLKAELPSRNKTVAGIITAKSPSVAKLGHLAASKVEKRSIY